MTSEGDTVLLRWMLREPDDPPLIKPSRGWDPTEDELTYETFDVILKTTVREIDGGTVIVEWFSDLQTVEPERLYPANQLGVPNEEIYPAHHQSPYTSLDELAADLKRLHGPGSSEDNDA